MLSLSNAPEVASEPGLREQVFHRRGRARGPFVVEPIRVPRHREAPDLLERHDRAARHLPLAAPALHVLFRPEEQNRRSRVGDVLPEPPRRDEVVDDSVALHTAVANRHRDWLAAIRAARPALAVSANQ